MLLPAANVKGWELLETKLVTNILNFAPTYFVLNIRHLQVVDYNDVAVTRWVGLCTHDTLFQSPDQIFATTRESF